MDVTQRRPRRPTRETDGWIHQAAHEHHRFPSPFSADMTTL
jgi:hypothetical protein